MIKSEHLRTEELRGIILHYDEILTMSARMASSTGDTIWETRYREYEPKLNGAIKEAIRFAPHLYTEVAEQVNTAHVALVKMEHQAFILVGINRSLEAFNILFSDEYKKQKQIYTDKINEFITHLRSDLEATLVKERRKMTWATITAVVAFLILFITWFVLIKNLNDWRSSIIAHINKRKKAEEKLQHAKMRLEEQNVQLRKVDRIKDALICDVTHELKTPVAKYAMQLDIVSRIIKGHNLMHEAERPLNVMRSTIKRQEGVLHNILDLSRLEAGRRSYKKEPVELSQLIKEVLKDYASALESHKIVLFKDLKPLTRESDYEMLFHVVSNIINNAIKYRTDKEQPEIRVSLEPNKTHAIVRIADNGVGLTREQVQRIFEKFYQASPSVEGSGVGLAICKKIMEDLGGKIWGESPGPNKGTTIFLEL
jgi:signal transduction histidine kinase